MPTKPGERGRPLGFDRAAALDAAIGTFWKHGYESTSTPLLETAMGISRSSMANTFGTKHQLLLACLDTYLDATESQLISPLHAHDTAGIDTCIRFFQRLTRLKHTGPGDCGCLMINTMTELASTDPDVARRAHRYHTALRSGFDAALRRDHPTGATIPAHAAETLVALAMAINLHARAHDTAALRATNSAARSLLETWRNQHATPG